MVSGNLGSRWEVRSEHSLPNAWKFTSLMFLLSAALCLFVREDKGGELQRESCSFVISRDLGIRVTLGPSLFLHNPLTLGDKALVFRRSYWSS